MRNFRILLLLIILLSAKTYAREGMWMPQLLKELNESDMKSLGMQLNAEDIYSINHSSLKDAVVLFGGGCTGEIISDKGLLITNHHCGFAQIQSLSTIEKNYLKDGFWSQNYSEEIPAPGLTVTFINEIKDVSDIILKDVADTLSDEIRNFIIKYRSDSLEKTISGKQKASVKSFYYGLKFYMFTMTVFKDIRLVGTPPQSIGKFGGETDNWMWPRHTGDFSLWRIYCDTNNLPAAYSKSNIPFKPAKVLSINIKGVEENDFVIAMGFPGRTQEYILSPALEQIEKQTNPNRIAIREARLNVMRDEMALNDTVKLLFSSKFSTLENAYKKWQGEVEGFRNSDAVMKKKSRETAFFGNKMTLLNSFDSLIMVSVRYNFANDFFAEAFPGIDLLNVAAKFKTLVELADSSSADTSLLFSESRRLNNELTGFYKNYYLSIDKRIADSLFVLIKDKFSDEREYYLKNGLFPAEFIRDDFNPISFDSKLFSTSILADRKKIKRILESNNRIELRKIKNDPAYILYSAIAKSQRTVKEFLDKNNSQQNRLQREFMRQLLLADKTKKLYPDANLTLRVAYGKVEGVNPADGIRYNYYTTSDGILAKNSKGISDYKITPRLNELLEKKDFGRYGKDGVLHVGFMSSSHTTGGNSGSPMLNAKGELVGLNYDRLWEGVISDYYYDEKISRNICLDIRYALFVIEKYGEGKRLIDEMSIVD